MEWSIQVWEGLFRRGECRTSSEEDSCSQYDHSGGSTTNVNSKGVLLRCTSDPFFRFELRLDYQSVFTQLPSLDLRQGSISASFLKPIDSRSLLACDNFFSLPTTSFALPFAASLYSQSSHLSAPGSAITTSRLPFCCHLASLHHVSIRNDPLCHRVRSWHSCS